MTIFEEMDETDIFYRDPNKSFSPLKNFLRDWREIETICDRRYKRDNFKIQQNKWSLLRGKHGSAHEEENDKEL